MAINQIGQIGVGSSNVYAVDYFKNPISIGIQATLDGTATFTVEYTLDDILADDFVAANAYWTPITGLSGISASTTVLFSTPCRGIRLTVASGTGVVVATICQAGIG